MAKWIIGRIAEPSTWAGIAALFMGAEATGVAAQLDAEFWTALGVVVAGLVAIFKGSPNQK